MNPLRFSTCGCFRPSTFDCAACGPARSRYCRVCGFDRQTHDEDLRRADLQRPLGLRSPRWGAPVKGAPS